VTRDTATVVISGHADTAMAVAAIKAGAINRGLARRFEQRQERRYRARFDRERPHVRSGRRRPQRIPLMPAIHFDCVMGSAAIDIFILLTIDRYRRRIASQSSAASKDGN
jgi:hypothetical protein